MPASGATGPHKIRLKNDNWSTEYRNYGAGSAALNSLFELYQNTDIDVDFSEIVDSEAGAVTLTRYTTTSNVLAHLQRPMPVDNAVRAITVRKLSEELIKLLGAYFGMDDELWTVRLLASEREYFAAPLNERGSQHFSHFHLACVDFFRATDRTPSEFKRSRKINHTTRLVKLIDSRPKSRRVKNQLPQIFVIRRVCGHLRKDENMWSFLYLCDDFVGSQEAHYERDTPGNTLSHLPNWITECVHDGITQQYGTKICDDGFGLVSKILRDIESSWKLMLTSLETFLEDMNDNFTDQEFIDAASFLHREYLLSIDYFARQLFYHERYVNYLTSEPSQPEIVIQPTTFFQDLVQEANALKVLTLRLNALRQRTTTVLDNILNLNSIQQSRIATRQTEIQVQDTKIALKQGESIRKLTLVNMAFLPPSFVAAVFGMNTPQTEDRQIWIFVAFASVLSIMTMTFALFRINLVSVEQAETNEQQILRRAPSMSWFVPKSMLRWIASFRISSTRKDPELPFAEDDKKTD